MTKHRDTEELIQKCLDREITVDENITLQLHLSQCPDCSSLYNELVLTEQAVSGLVEFTPNFGFNNRVIAQVKVKRVPVWVKLTGIMSGVSVATFLAILLSPLGQDIFGRILFSAPSLVRFADKLQLVVTTLARIAAPMAKSQFNPTALIIGIGLSIGTFLFFGKVFSKKEIVWNA